MPERWSRETSPWIALLVSVVAMAPGRAHAEKAGRLSVVASPNGEVIVDGRATGVSTPVTDLEAPAGVHEVVVRHSQTGLSSSPQRVYVRAGATTFVYALPRRVSTGIADCEGPDHRTCFRALEDAMRAGDRSNARMLARRYVERFPNGGYMTLVTPITDALAHDEEVRVVPPNRLVFVSLRIAWLGAVLVALVLASAFAARRARRRRST